MVDQKQIICPDCQSIINQPSSIAIGDILECSECGTEVEIISLDPLTCQELFEEK